MRLDCMMCGITLDSVQMRINSICYNCLSEIYKPQADKYIELEKKLGVED